MLQFDKDLQSDFKPLFLRIRDFLLSFEGVEETKKPRITTYATASGGICHLRTMPHGVDIGFLKGIHLQDEYDLLHGRGKKMRILSLKKFDEAILQYYLDQAVTLNL